MATGEILLLSSLLILMENGEARVHTEAQSGPLYRVVGSRLSITCSTSGFRDDALVKVFEFRVRKPDKPNFEHNIIKTDEKDFSYNLYMSRVKKQEITLNHTSSNSVVFVMQNLKKEDEGEYECSVVNHEVKYDGTYSAKMAVKVIDDSLSVSSPAASTSHHDGEELTLTCRASSNTLQHTHLSVAWFLHRQDQDNAHMIISLDRDFTLRPGPSFKSRYEVGLIELSKRDDALYSLGIARLELSDQGRIYCQAQEWIQDPDLSWYSISKKNSEGNSVQVTALQLASETESLVVGLTAGQTALQEGQPLMLACHVNAHDLEEKMLSVAWLRNNKEVARIGPTGIESVSTEYKRLEKEGSLRVSRVGLRDYQVIMASVRTEDSGVYSCRVWVQHKDLKQGAPQDSEPLAITVVVLESELSVQLQQPSSINESEELKLICHVQGVKGQLSITWKRKLPSTTIYDDIITLSEEGIMAKGEVFLNRAVVASRPAPKTFVLELKAVTPADSGGYCCAVSEHAANKKTNSQSQMANVTVLSIASLYSVSLKSRKNSVKVGDRLELMCIIRGPQLALTVTWSLQRDSSTIDNILTLYSNASISWAAGQHQFQLKVQNQPAEKIFYLLANKASHREAGKFQCRASVYQEKVYKKLQMSNMLAIVVENPESQLQLKSIQDMIAVVNSDVELSCCVTSATSSSAQYAVSWILFQGSTNVSVVSLDRDSSVRFGRLAEDSRHRISIRRTADLSFKLTIRQTVSADSGYYTCEVVEWLQDPRGEWFSLPAASTTTNLTLTEPGQIPSKSGYQTDVWIGVLVSVIVLLVLVITLLLLKIRKTKHKPKTEDSLWEEHSLKVKE